MSLTGNALGKGPIAKVYELLGRRGEENFKQIVWAERHAVHECIQRLCRVNSKGGKMAQVEPSPYLIELLQTIIEYEEENKLEVNTKANPAIV